MAIGWLGMLAFFILWMRSRGLKQESKYNKQAIYEIRKELRSVNEKLKLKIDDIRTELYDLFVSVDKLLVRL
jgi:hypothetical protein